MIQALACKCDITFVSYRSVKYPIAGTSIVECNIIFRYVKHNIA